MTPNSKKHIFLFTNNQYIAKYLNGNNGRCGRLCFSIDIGLSKMRSGIGLGDDSEGFVVIHFHEFIILFVRRSLSRDAQS